MARKADGSIREWPAPIVAIPRDSIGFVCCRRVWAPSIVFSRRTVVVDCAKFFRDQFDGLNWKA